jgi:type II secretory pathway component PulJ
VAVSLAEAASSRSEELWLVSLAVGSLAIVLLAVLFGLVIAVLQRIDRHAARTHTAAKQIAQNTVALWTLEQTNRDLIAIRDAARGAARADAASALAGPLSAVSQAVSQKVHDVLGRAEPGDDGSS